MIKLFLDKKVSSVGVYCNSSGNPKLQRNIILPNHKVKEIMALINNKDEVPNEIKIEGVEYSKIHIDDNLMTGVAEKDKESHYFAMYKMKHFTVYAVSKDSAIKQPDFEILLKSKLKIFFNEEEI